MNTHTILNVKTDKKLKAEAKKVSEELGVPLSTVINAFLKQFVRDKEITLSANKYLLGQEESESNLILSPWFPACVISLTKL